MAKKGPRQPIRLRSTKSRHCYISEKNTRNTQDKITTRKYDPVVREHVEYREEKLK